MIIGVISAIAILALMGGVIVWIGSLYGQKGVKSKVAIGSVILVALFFAFILIPFSFHTVKTGEIAVVRHMGAITETRNAGIHFDLWLTDKYIKYDTKVRTLDCTAAAYSLDAQTMDIQMTVQYQIVSDKVIDIATQYGKLDILENRIQTVALEKTKSVLSSHKAMDIIANRAAISPAVEQAIREAVGEEYCVSIVAVVITNIDFSDAFELAVEEKMIAEQNKIKADYENEAKVAKAEADAEAKLRAAEAEVQIAEAEAEARLIAANAEAEANRIIDESITDKILDKSIIDAWDGQLPTVVGDGEYILPSDFIS